MSESLLGGEGGDAPAEPISEPTLTPESSSFSFYGDEGINPGLSSHFDDNNKSAQKFFEKYRSAEDPNKAAIDGIANLQYMAGQKAFERPSEDAPESVRGEFDRKMRELNGAPAEVSDYGYERPESVAEELWNQDQMDGFAGILHKHGASPEMASELLETYVGSFEGAQEQAEKMQLEQIQAQRNLLTSEYGVDAEKMIASAVEMGKAIGAPQSEIERIGQTAEGVKLLASLKNLVSGDLISNSNSAGSVNGSSGSNYQDLALEASNKASVAHAKGDMTAYKKYAEQQSQYNQMYAKSLR